MIVARMNGSSICDDRGGVGHLGRAVDLDPLAADHLDEVADVGGRRQQLEVVLALEPLAHDLHVEEPEEAAAEAEAERLRVLRLVGERRVVERQLVERVAEVLEAVGVDREEAAEDHRLDLAIALERAGRGPLRGGQRVADPQLRHVLDPCDHVSHLARLHPCDRRHHRAEEADVVDVRLGAVLHRQDPLALAKGAVEHAHVGDHAAVLVELRVEDQRPGSGPGLARGRRDAGDDRLEDVDHTLPGLRRDPHHLARLAAEQVGDLPRDPLRVGTGRSTLLSTGISSRPLSIAR